MKSLRLTAVADGGNVSMFNEKSRRRCIAGDETSEVE
jgi:hypothetical protein